MRRDLNSPRKGIGGVEITYSLAIRNGDLAQVGSALEITYGVNKLKQDLTLWMMEQYGTDRFHPTMGSILQDFIGRTIGNETQVEVQSEALRILQNYQSVQLRGLKQTPQVYSLSELLHSIDDIRTTISFDTVSVAIWVRNAQNEISVINVAQSL